MAVETSSKFMKPNTFHMHELYARKGVLEARFEQWKDAEKDLLVANQFPLDDEDKLLTQHWLTYVLEKEKKYSEALPLYRNNLQLAENLYRAGACRRITVISDMAGLARFLDVIKQRVEADTLWSEHLELIRLEFGTKSSNYAECLNAFMSRKHSASPLQSR